MRKREKKRLLKLPYGCLVVLVLIAIAAVGLVFFIYSGKVKVARMLDEIRAAGEPVTAAGLEPPDVPDDENAFLVYEQAGGMLVRTPDNVQEAIVRLLAASPRKWSRTDVQLLRSHVAQNASTVQLARKGTKLSGFKSDTSWDKWEDVAMLGPGWQVNCIALVKQLAYKTLLDVGEGRIEAAIETCDDALRLAAHCRAEPTTVSYLVANACQSITMSSLEKVISQTRNIPQLREVIAILDAPYNQAHLKEAFVAERTIGISFRDAVRSGQLPGAGQASTVERTLTSLYGWFTYNDEAAYLEITAVLIDLADRQHYEIRQELTDLKARIERLPKYAALTQISADVYTKMHEKFAATRAETQVLRTAAGVKIYRLKHGKYPTELSDLVPDILTEVPIDEFRGDELRYRRTVDGFVVYSVGPNMINDAGVKGKDRNSGDIAYVEP